jgi:transcriptional regulator with XRE-family HTH domain
MTRIIDQQRAIKLRKQGKTYNEIKKALNISKSTLSNWLSSYPLSQQQLSLLKNETDKNRSLGIEKTIITKQRKREKRLEKLYENEKKRWLLLNSRELELAGLFLYWGEGKKNLKSALAINNTDPQVVKFALRWMTEALNVPKSKIKIELHLYSDMNALKEISFWGKQLGIAKNQFYRPYIKQSTRININQKGFGHGTCGVMVNDVRLKEKVIMGIKAIADKYSNGF